MRTKGQGRNVFALSVAVLLVFILLAAFTYSLTDAINSECYAQAQEGKNACSAYHLMRLTLANTGAFFALYGPGLTICATIVIAIFNWFLVESTDKLWEAGERQIGVAEKSASAAKDAADAALASAIAADDAVRQARESAEKQLRAYVWRSSDASKMKVSAQDVDDAPPIYHFRAESRIFNSGKTPAYNVSVWSRLALYDKDLPDGFEFEQPPISFEGPRFVVNPRSKHTVSTPADPVPYVTMNAYYSGTKVLYLWGQIKYIDAFDYPRITNFRMSHQFVLDSAAKAIWAYCDDGNEAD